MSVLNVGLLAGDLPDAGTGDAMPALRRWIQKSITSGINPVFVPPGRYRLSSDVAVPREVALEMMQGAEFEIARAATLSIAGHLSAKPTRIFAGEGRVLLSERTREALPEWWGASPEREDNRAEIQAALDSGAGTVRILVGTFTVGGELRFHKIGQSLVGDSMQEAMITSGPGFRGACVIRVSGGPHQRIERLKIEASPQVDCLVIESSAAFALRDVQLRGGNAGVRYRQGNIERWDNVYAESCGDGIVVDPSSDDTNGGTLVGVRAYDCTRWGIDVRSGDSPLGSSYNTWDASAENCANGIRIRGGQYCQYTLYSENHRGDRFDVQGPHWFFLRNADNDATIPLFGGSAIGVHGTGTNLYFDTGQAPERVGRQTFRGDDTLGGNGVRMWDVANASGSERTMTLQFLETHHVGFRCTITKRDNTAGFRIAAPDGITLSGNTGVFGAYVNGGCAMLEVMKISASLAILKQS